MFVIITSMVGSSCRTAIGKRRRTEAAEWELCDADRFGSVRRHGENGVMK